MATYAIGDIQGCYDPLQRLLEKVKFDPGQDQLWFCGDLVNRGGHSLAALRLIYQLRQSCVAVLGNHDLHLLADAAGCGKPGASRNPEFEAIYAAADGQQLIQWLRYRPLFHCDRQLGCAMVHAGLLPQWDLSQAKAYAKELETVIRTDHGRAFFRHMYEQEPDQWQDTLAGWPRLRTICNVLTRLRFCDHNGRMALGHKGPPGSQPKAFRPWFQLPRRQPLGITLVFGHWSALGYRYQGDTVALDSGCVWGKQLTAIDLERPKQPIQVAC